MNTQTDSSARGLTIGKQKRTVAHVNGTPTGTRNGQDAAAHAQDNRRFYLSETGLAERFARDHGQAVRWCETWKKWLVYTETHWQIDASQHVRTRAKQVVRSLYTEATAATDSDTRKELGKFALRSEAEKVRRALLELAKSEDPIPALPTQFDSDHSTWLLNVSNGTIDLKTGTLRAHDPADYLTKCIPIVYDPKAVCPTWETFLTTTMDGKEDVINFLWKAIGYSLTGDTTEQCLFFCHGAGSNGKSTFLNILRAVVGTYGKQTAFSTFLHHDRETVRNDLADLAGTRLVVASEIEEGKRLNAVVVKTLTGDDPIKARFLFAEYFEFSPHMKIWLGMNHKPVITDTTYAMWRRVRLIPFTQTFEGDACDVSLPDKLRAELPGILAWAVRGCLAWQEERLPLPEAVRVATAEYRDDMDVLSAFLGECCILDPRADVLTASLYDRYAEWCKKSGENMKTKKGFGLAMQDHGFESGQISGGLRIWKGLNLAS